MIIIYIINILIISVIVHTIYINTSDIIHGIISYVQYYILLLTI